MIICTSDIKILTADLGMICKNTNVLDFVLEYREKTLDFLYFKCNIMQYFE